tara:strand:+ start:4036 stop:4686 length:651 start_codon:yes stop_codon:yes gene_type:complete
MLVKNFKHENDKDSIIIYINNIYNNIEQTELLSYLNNMDDFEEGHNQFGKVPRLQKWYQIDGCYFSKTWKCQDHKRWISKEYDNTLLKIQNNIQKIVNMQTNIKFNSCLINKYRDGNDSINHHRDTHTSFGNYPIIAGLSLGDERILEFKRILYNEQNNRSMKEDKINSNDNFSINLESGSLLIMMGSTQKYFSHGIPVNKNSNLRYSLTFRNYIK